MADPHPLQGLLRQAQEMQKRLKALQEEAARERVEGSAGGGLVRVIATAGQEIVQLQIDPSLIDPADPELLADLIASACNDALRKGRDLLQAKMGSATSGLDLSKLTSLFGG
ncbi:MAG: YbaB/EbfC family nucleoid-associated protein [Deltaproteobacteria bacterium]|nr:YbaB/EbfC family nucleoid-associated protein [Deltaproteobacteria bacterium]PIU78923.1 MAG: YbaB/EbfC family nucleoid-associated protein [Nitrospirae bacterium CG06_land_8_20_14_3_00_70_43]PIX82911.1 MAG: YbaB/EbfC family nucleoid-associated protein [Nitrospirae bacterium CG_4_10_14_3_um_filter_70_108]HBB39903.1 YbaB/EbfC family nucleoid-associated protein [Pseudomonadota bacterium]NCP95478.1 YbaB/EbfC family nucleoid-associated protein [Deltaproteobacteria bacterium]